MKMASEPAGSLSNTFPASHTNDLHDAADPLYRLTGNASHSFKNHASKHSVSSTASINTTRSHQDYLDSLVPPTMEELERISTIQQQKEVEMIRQHISTDNPDLTSQEQAKAAGLIQRNYRGYRERRRMNGKGLDAGSRWTEAIKEARYRNLTTPRPRASQDNGRSSTEGEAGSDGIHHHPSVAMQNWAKVGTIAKRAVGDEDSDDVTSDEDDIPEHDREEHRKKRAAAKLERQKAAMVMDLQYWLESTDLKHRYGANLRSYHQQWVKSDTHESFFYWLDYGEGKNLDVAGCPRERLDREQVRYLSKEERLQYLVKIDKKGRLCWAKDGTLIDTTVHFKDSIRGIVREDDPTPAYTAPEGEAATGLQDPDVDSEITSDEYHGHDDAEAARANKYATPGIDNAPVMKKVKHMSAATVFQKLLRSSVQKNTWIYVADTSFRLYVGIKQSGAFQHSSFLQGSRISSAGLIKIKDGRLAKLSPLSGHYRPPTSSFRAFKKNLKDEGVDMSHVAISRSYAVLRGLEAYVKSRKRGKRVLQVLVNGRDKLISPEELRQRQEEELDRTESIEAQHRITELQEDKEDRENGNASLLQKLHLGRRSGERARHHEANQDRVSEAELAMPGKQAESFIPPAGMRSSEGERE